MATKIGVPVEPAAKPVTLSKEEILRYSRHLIMPEVGMDGQLKIKQAKVLCIGTGGLGAPLGLYLAAAGVGRLGLVDFDVVDSTNLQRQVLFGTSDVGKPKIRGRRESPARSESRHPHRHFRNAADQRKRPGTFQGLRHHRGRHGQLSHALSGERRLRAAGQAQCLRLDLPLRGQITIFGYPGGPCYRCLYPEPPPPGLVPSCAEGGVLGVLPGIVGTIQATETLKLILGKGEPLDGPPACCSTRWG